MITKFQIFEQSENSLFESNGNKRLFYHATKPEYLPEILKHGLTPNIDRKTNWGDELGKWSKGKIFVTDELSNAIFYGKLINGYSFSPILRMWIDKNKLTFDEDSGSDWYSKETINGDFEIKIDDVWAKLTMELAENIINDENINEKRVNREEREELYKDDNFIVIRPLTHEASRKYGCDTNWCTSVDNKLFWDEHTINGIIIYVINRHENPDNLFLRNKKVKEFQNLFNTDEWEKLPKKWKIEKFLDFSRIAISYSPDEYGFAIHDAHNFDLQSFEIYDVNDLPIPKKITKIIDNYIIKWRKLNYSSLSSVNLFESYFDENIDEGLISTFSTKKTVKILKRKFPDYYISILPDGEIEISAGRKEHVSDNIKDIFMICNQLGWYISHGNIDYSPYEFNKDEFFEMSFDDIVLKPIFDSTRNIDIKPSILYYITPVKNVDKILKIGLTPKPKVNLTDELELAWGMKKELERTTKQECEILKILANDLDIKLYSDIDSRRFGYYTFENIPPKFISILPKEDYRKHWLV